MAISPKYSLSFNSWGQEETDALQRVIQSGQFTMGPCVAAFEKSFASYLGAKHAIMVNSGSSANLIAVASLFWRKQNPLCAGDEVIVPALAWSTTYAPLSQYGLKLKVVDIDSQTLNVDIEQVKRAITPRTRMLVGVSILGNPANLTALRAIAEEHNLTFMEDNCESLGASLEGRLTGSFGDISTCSFFFAHHISTMEGGIITTNSDELSELARSLRAHGWTRELPKDSLLFERTDDSFSEAYRFLLPGYNVRPLEFSGATGLEQMKKLPAMLEWRRKNAAYFRARMEADSRFQLQKEFGESSSYCFTMLVKPDSGLSRARVLEQLREFNIEFRMITGGNIARHPVAQHLNLEIFGALKNADWVHDGGFFVGNAPVDMRGPIDQLCLALGKL